MDPMTRRRNGKGIGETVGSTHVEGSRSQSIEVAGTAESADVAGSELVRLQGVEDSGVSETRPSGTELPGNPFWSQRARDELQLQLMRPDFLGNAVETPTLEASSSSTELRAAGTASEQFVSPQGLPTTYGPAVLQTTVGEGRIREPLNANMAGERNRASSGEPAVEGAEAGPETSHGLSVRERYVLSQMKEAMVQIAQQNEQLVSQNEALWSRVVRLEAERSNSTTAFHSVSAQDPQEVIEHNNFGVIAQASSGIVRLGGVNG